MFHFEVSSSGGKEDTLSPHPTPLGTLDTPTNAPSAIHPSTLPPLALKSGYALDCNNVKSVDTSHSRSHLQGKGMTSYWKPVKDV